MSTLEESLMKAKLEKKELCERTDKHTNEIEKSENLFTLIQFCFFIFLDI